MLTTIPPDLEAFIQAEVASGRYSSADEAIATGIRLLQERERQIQVLREQIELGMRDLERGAVISIRTEEDRRALIEDIQRRGRERLQRLSQP